LPRVLTETAAVRADAAGATGAVWKLQMRERDLDANIIALGPRAGIEAHTGPDVDVLVHILSGSGQLTTELDTLALRSGMLVWLPRRSRRQVTAGPDGLRYLTVHQRRQALTLTTAPR
jgi:quercetin dioxygenase-like cupin family protein